MTDAEGKNRSSKQKGETPISVYPRSGCAAKLPGVQLVELLEDAYSEVFGPDQEHPMQHPEDCGHLVVSKSIRLAASVDMIPAFGPSPRLAGRIAALHAMNDVFATGCQPGWALPLLIARPSQPQEARDLLTGLLEACRLERVQVVAGHTMTGREAAVGLSVLGRSGEHRLRKRGARVGDRLLLSKPVGFGLVLHAVAVGELPPNALDEVLEMMLASNGKLVNELLTLDVHACTDVSGFGLLGHLSEMLTEGQGARVDAGAVPMMPSAASVPDAVKRSGAIRANHAYALERAPIHLGGDWVRYAHLLDPQTNGGLLVAATRQRATELVAKGFSDIGSVTDGPGVLVEA